MIGAPGPETEDPPPSLSRRARQAWRRSRKGILLGGLAIGLLLGVRASMGRLEALEADQIPSHPAIGVALVLLLAGQSILGYGWRRLVPAISDPVTSMWTFHAAQPGKYLPLGVGHALGQVTLARDMGVETRAAVAGWASHVLMIVVAGTSVGALVALNPDLGSARWFALAGLLGIVAVYRPVLQRVVGVGARFTARLPAPDDLPAQRGLVEAYLSAVAFMVLDGLAFVVLLHGFDRGALSWIGLLGAYGVAMGLSIVSPLPAGIGIREGLLVLLSGTDPAATLAAAIVLRVATFGVEVALLAVFSAWQRGRRPISRPR